MQRTLGAAFIAVAGMSTTAYAADIYAGSTKDTPVAYEAAPAPIWSGLYVGGHIGGLWNDSGNTELSKRRKDKELVCEDNGPNELNKQKNPKQKKCEWVWGEWTDWYKLESATFDEDDKVSFLGGVHIGYNWQNGDKVFGIEGDLSFSDGIDYLASLRARLGHSWDNVLIYATAGVAFAGFEDKTVHAYYDGHEYGLDISGEREIGFVVGGGIERKVSSNVSVGLEGLYYFFDDAEYSEGFGPYCSYKSCVEKKLTHEDDNDLLVVRARLNYHIQPDEPSLEIYK